MLIALTMAFAADVISDAELSARLVSLPGPVRLVVADLETDSAVRRAQVDGRLPSLPMGSLFGAGCYVALSVSGAGWGVTTSPSCTRDPSPEAGGADAPPVVDVTLVASFSALPLHVPVEEGDPALVAAIVGLADGDARQARLLRELAQETDADRAGRLGAASAVLTRLRAGGRDDRTVVRLFLVAALSADPSVRAAALDAAMKGGDPPIAGATAPVAGAAPTLVAGTPPTGTVVARPVDDTLARLRSYKARRLTRGALSIMSAGYSAGIGGAPGFAYASSSQTWGVFQGGATPLGPRPFAVAVGDASTVGRLNHRRAAAHVGGPLLTITGGLMAIGGTLLTTSGDGGALVIGLASTGIGSGLVAGGVIWWLTPVFDARSTAARFYSPDDADALIEQYNAKLREELRLSDEDAARIDLTFNIGPGSIGVHATF